MTYDPAKDPIIQIEIALNFISTLRAQAIAFKDKEIADELFSIRHSIYYEKEFDYESIIKKLQEIQKKLEIFDNENDKPLTKTEAEIEKPTTENKEPLDSNNSSENNFKMK